MKYMGSKNLDAVSIETKLYELLKEKGLTVATAESCTGGMIAAKIINVSGVSEVFVEGYVTYANEAKIRLLRVKKGTLSKYGAVSAQTAKEMAEGAVKRSGAACAIVTTGIAGPTGGTKEKPVGLVYIGCCVNGLITVRECHFDGDRQSIRTSATMEAIEMLVDILKE